jgi:hypothetical protein
MDREKEKENRSSILVSIIEREAAAEGEEEYLRSLLPTFEAAGKFQYFKVDGSL